MPVSETLAESLRQALSSGPELRLAVLFGSGSRGILRADSDLDIAILPADPGLPLAEELLLQGRLAQAGRREVDLVRIDGASTLLLWQIARSAELLLGDPKEFTSLLARAALDYADYEPLARSTALLYAQRSASRMHDSPPS